MNIDPSPDQRRAELLTRASGAIEVHPLDAAQVVTIARTRRRRRRGAIAGVLAAVSVVTVLVGASLIGAAGGDPRPLDSADSSVDAVDRSRFPAPPSGSKWVGLKGVVVAVPVEWPVYESPCEGAAPAEVLDGTSSPAVRCTGARVQEARVILEPIRDGRETDTNRTCSIPFGQDKHRCGGSSAVPERDVRIEVMIRGDFEVAMAQRDAILDSTMVLPEGWTTVPSGFGTAFQQRVRLLEEAGFEVTLPDGEIGGFEPVVMDPAFGSPVEEGGTISISPAEVPDEPQPQPVLEVAPSLLSPGEQFEVDYPGPRGIGFILTAVDGTTYYLSVGGNRDAVGTWSETPQGWDDIAVSGPGRAVVPDVAAPGPYELCTANTQQPACATLTVVEARSPEMPETNASEAPVPDTDLACLTDMAQSATLDYFTPVPGDSPTASELADRWASGDAFRVEGTTAYLLRPDGGVYAVLTLGGAPSSGYRVETYTACANVRLVPMESQEVTLDIGHCWIEPVSYRGREWAPLLADQIGNGGALQAGFTGEGALTSPPSGLDLTRYTDNEGAHLDLYPTTDPRTSTGACD